MGSSVGKGTQRLELNWINKDVNYVLEPRIILEDEALSYGSSNTKNMLIQGDNLLALKALEQDFTGKIKCIYIDPPYNSGNAFEHYDDGLEHSIWLNLMKPRLELLRNLLSKDGVLFISIDDKEAHYLKVLCDEVFLRKNFIGSMIWEKKKKPSFLSNMGVVTEYILCYGKSEKDTPPFIYGETTKNKKYPINNAGNGLNILTFPKGSVTFKLKDQIIKPQDMSEGNIKTVLLDELKIVDGKNENDFRLEGEWRYGPEKIIELAKDGADLVISQIPFRPNHIKSGGEPKKMKNLLSISHYNMATYEDATKESIELFGKNAFDYPKPEKLLYTLINAVTKEGDIVLDSFLGSATTAAVAHKMKRKWIGIELGEHAFTHGVPRLKKIINGKDKGGITDEVKWEGGGGFKYYTLAPSLIKKDKYGTEIINPQYNANMLAAAMAKQEGFRYQPDENNYWKQGISSEKDFIFTTTQFVTVAMLDKLIEELKPGESLLVCCKSFAKGCASRHTNITIKKIPQMLLGRCEFGKDDYSFNIVNLPRNDDTDIEIEDSEESEAPKAEMKTKAKKQKDDDSQSSLF